MYYLQRVHERAGCVANSADPDQTPHMRRLIRVYTVCSGLSVQILSVNMENNQGVICEELFKYTINCPDETDIFPIHY